MAIPLDRARELVLAGIGPLPAEAVAVGSAAGRVLAADVRARADCPPETNSAMDGFAVTAGPTGRTLRLIGESRAGAPSRLVVDPATALRIATGGVLPPGAEAVVAVERASVSGDRVTLHETAVAGRNVRRAGEDMRVDQVVLAGGTRLGAVELVVAIGAGQAELGCRRRPRVAVIGTGDELRDPGVALGPGQVHDSNTTALAALAEQAGAMVVRAERAGDQPDAIRRALETAFAESDVVIVSGGVSVGAHDHVRPALAAAGAEQAFWGVEIRPGRPVWFGRRGDVAAFGLPGNPVSAVVAFILLVRPLLAARAGSAADANRLKARLAVPVAGHPDRTTVVGVRLSPAGRDWPQAAPSGRPGSHMTTEFLGADGLALIPPGPDVVAAGSEVDVERLWT